MGLFNPNDIGIANGNYFALPVELTDSEIVLLSVPWDATVSYKNGTASAPQSIIDASVQVDLFDANVENAWDIKLGTIPLNKSIIDRNKRTRRVVEGVIDSLEIGKTQKELSSQIDSVNSDSEIINSYVCDLSEKYLEKGKMVGIVGGEHSVPFGLIKALSRYYDDFGVLHIDAHADLRVAYEGFKYSHASIMYNVLNEIPQVSKITQVAIRDYCSQESQLISQSDRVVAFTDFNINKVIFEGGNWGKICDDILNSLPTNVYISFDIDGLSPECCPGTGTPVPGGLSFSQADYLLEKLAKSDKKIIGFDLCEVSPSDDSEWDANVGARILFKLSLYSHFNRGK